MQPNTQGKPLAYTTNSVAQLYVPPLVKHSVMQKGAIPQTENVGRHD
jgi:hypothetical protein